MPSGGIRQKTALRDIARIGAQNDRQNEKKPAEKLRDWCRTHKKEAKAPWLLVEGGQVGTLASGEMQDPKLDKPLYKTHE